VIKTVHPLRSGDLSARLDALGFCRLKGLPVYRRGELDVAPGRDFWTISARALSDRKQLIGQIGKRGLWKLVRRAAGGLAWEFHLPAMMLAQSGSWDDEQDLLALCLDWAEATLDGEVHSAWRPPSKKQLDEWLGKDRLTVQNGPLMRQAMVLCDERRLAVRFPLAPQASPQLSATRRLWLDHVLREAQDRWRMARVGYGSSAPGEASLGDMSPAVCAEIDLTGAPEGALECLLKTGVDGLRWVVSWLLWPVGFLSDPGVTSSAWEIPPARAFGPQKGEGHA
jgi:hypothetical protein